MNSIFILELFLRNYYRLWESDDPKVAYQWMTPLLMLDLVLLENQLPFFVLKILFTLAFPSPSKKFLSLIQLTFLYFDCFNVQNITSIDVKIEVEHFTDLVRTFQLPPIPSLTGRQIDVEKLWYSAMDLVEAGVKFKVSSSRCLLDLKFNFEYRLLEMPLLVINNHTEALTQNLMALELFRHGEKKYIMDYFYILNFLVNNTKDMDLLCDKGVMVNYLSDNKAATSMVKIFAPISHGHV